jgi:3-oxoacyl-[acyl-carrier-protein] synthase-3
VDHAANACSGTEGMINSGERVAITGTGHNLPPTIRGNDDPIFDYLHEHHPPGEDLFKGYKYRRVLDPGQSLEDLMVGAASRALEDARLGPGDIDLITGYASISEFMTPNGLARVHHLMELPGRCIVLPIADEFTNALSSLIVADSMIRTTRARNALVVVGCNWTQYSNYEQPQSISSSDAAGAFIMSATSDRSRFSLVDYEVDVELEAYGSMYMAPSLASGAPFENATYSKAWYNITDEGISMFKGFGVHVPPTIVNAMLARNGLAGADITLVPYQASTVLSDAWTAQIKPSQCILSIEELANMTLASIPVNLSREYAQIEKDWIVLVAVGPQFQAIALLLRRNA